MNWIGFYTLVNREVGRFFSVYRQTVLPGLISSALYILIFGFTLEQRISEIDGVSYTWYILPGLIMMNTLSNATANTSSSMLQMKLLQQLPDLLTAPLSGVEISLAYIIGGTIRGMVNGMDGIVPAKKTSAVFTRMASVLVIILNGTSKGKRLKRFTTARVKELKNIW